MTIHFRDKQRINLLFVQTQHLIIYFCQSLWRSGQGRQQPGSVGRQTHLQKEERARTHARVHALQSASDSLRSVATMVTLKLNSASAAKTPMLLHVGADKCDVCGGTFVLPVALCPTSPSQTRPPCLHTEPLLSCIVV